MGLTLKQFQEAALKTDVTPQADPEGGLKLLLFGLFGEIGSLLSALKKHRRDTNSFSSYEEAVLEELGDCLWYLAATCDRLHIPLGQLGVTAERAIPEASNAIRADDVSFLDISALGRVSLLRTRPLKEDLLLELGETVGQVLGAASTKDVETTQEQLARLLLLLGQSAELTEVSLDEAAQNILRKNRSRWPEEYVYPPLFDATFEAHEQLPRQIKMEFQEHSLGGKAYVIQRWNGVNIGDRLTDNSVDEDDYRFHDVFHLSYAAHLGWSPVLRALLRVKRKSQPKVDEVQDGARAILIEEGVSTWIFGKASTHNFFEGVERVDYSVLKAVQDFVAGYEVERCYLWQWERAILSGYEIFRHLRRHRSGFVTADLNAHTLTFEQASS